MHDVLDIRRKEYPAHDIFVKRWSPRAMSGEKIKEWELMTLFEAARWAPSSYNNQHWRFIYAVKESSQWSMFFDLLTEGNRIWAKDAAALVVMISKKSFDYNGKPALTHSFDTGAAWENLALQGSINGLVVHGMQGFDYQKARQKLEIPDDYQVEAMAAIEKPGKKEDLPKKLQQMEFPSKRKKISDIVFQGRFKR